MVPLKKQSTKIHKSAVGLKDSKLAVKTKASIATDRPFFIVGIGASAGGLEALEQLLGQVPADSGLAFVVIQHLDPNYKGMMPELLQRCTNMQVIQAGNAMKVRPDCVYVLPPNNDLSIVHGSLHLTKPTAPRGLRLPIDFFLQSLAEDQRENSIGVILSGMGSDGTSGLRSIKEKAGLVLVQEPASAKFDSMPKSAINAGLADIIAPAQEIPKKIIDFIRHMPTTPRVSDEPETAIQKSALDRIFLLLRARTGHDFSMYKKSTIYRRIERRMALHHLEKIADYVRYLRENPQELDLLLKELLIGVTSFFRDPATWICLQEQVLPQVLQAYRQGETMRAWVAGCSTGEEAFSLAIAFNELMERTRPEARIKLQIFATDLNEDAIDKARIGYYPASIAVDVSASRLARYFVKQGSGYCVVKEIREMVVFAPQNVIMDPPFTRLELLLCRNLFIYFGPELQKKLLPLFHYCLTPGGYLLLGTAETVGGLDGLYTPIDAKQRIYRRSDTPPQIKEVHFPSRLLLRQPGASEGTEIPPAVVNFQTQADQFLLQQFCPAAVLVNKEGDILYISGKTGKYLEPAAGKANWNIHVMARDGLRQDLAMLLGKALRTKEPATAFGLRVGTNGSTQTLDLTVRPIDQPDALHGMAMIVFTDVATAAIPSHVLGKQTASRGKLAQLALDLQGAREENQLVREAIQSQQEELKSANEELQSTNEELQSTNEELTTSKEEMQSLNEELQTVNSELQSKVDDLSMVNSDMKNLLDSTDIATVFLDNALNVRSFTNRATNVFKLIPGDVARPLSDIVTDLDYAALEADAREVLRSLVISEKQISTRDARWFMVKIMPYRTLDNVIDGVVITCNDISVAKRLEAQLRRTQAKPADRSE